MSKVVLLSPTLKTFTLLKSLSLLPVSFVLYMYNVTLIVLCPHLR